MSVELISTLPRSLAIYAKNPTWFAKEILGVILDPWQADVLGALMDPDIDTVFVRSPHATGKTLVEAVAVLWTLVTAVPQNPTDLYPTVVAGAISLAQVRNVLFGTGINRLWSGVASRVPVLYEQFECMSDSIRNVDRPRDWFAVGIATDKGPKMEGYHPNLIVFDEAKGIPPAAWFAAAGARMHSAEGRRTKLLAVSTPGSVGGEYWKAWNEWYKRPRTAFFLVRSEVLRSAYRWPEVKGVHPVTGQIVVGGYAKGCRPDSHECYYSPRCDALVIEEIEQNFGGKKSPIYMMKAVGDFPDTEEDRLFNYSWVEDAKLREVGAPGLKVVAVDVARFGRDRTVAFVMDGGTVLHGDSIGKTREDTTAPEIDTVGVGPDPKQPLYRDIDVVVDFVIRLAIEWGTTIIAVDDTGLAGVSAMLRRKGWTVVPFNFGSAPTDLPTDKEDRDFKKRRTGWESRYANIKAQMAWELRNAFELGEIAFAALDKRLKDPLIAQTLVTKYKYDDKQKMHIIDPDEQTALDLEFFGPETKKEAKRSPDHLHALMIGAFVALEKAKPSRPQAGKAISHPHHKHVIGSPTSLGGAAVAPPSTSGVGGQGVWVSRWFK